MCGSAICPAALSNSFENKGENSQYGISPWNLGELLTCLTEKNKSKGFQLVKRSREKKDKSKMGKRLNEMKQHHSTETRSSRE